MLIVEKDWSIDYIKELAEKKKPRYIFFPFYSKKIPPELYENYECVVFHMTDLPYGRGGTPLQNLIMKGLTATKISALRVNNIIDGGDIYRKRRLSLGGTAEEIYMRAELIIKDMIYEITHNQPKPKPQKGVVVNFKRRKPEHSNIKKGNFDLDKLYDFIRMLDAEGYPHAFLETDKLRFEFTRASLKKGHIIADVKITCRSGSR